MAFPKPDTMTQKEPSKDPYLQWRKLSRKPATRQVTEDTCWAAALSWWADAMGNGRPKRTPEQIYWEYAGLLAGQTENTMPMQTLIRVWSEPIWKATVIGKPHGFSPDWLTQQLRYGPLMLAFVSAASSVGHVVVVVVPSSRYGAFVVMDPAVADFPEWGYGRFTANYALFAGPR